MADVALADWFVEAEADWRAKVTLGPPGFEAYAKVLVRIDDDSPVDVNGHVGSSLRGVLARHTTTPDKCFFCLWDGFGGFEGGPQDIGLRYALPPDASSSDREEARRLEDAARLRDYAPAFDVSFIRGPKVSVPNRDYYLFTGPLSEDVDWGAADFAPGLPREYDDEPALLWPADHAWFAACDTDSDWIGVGGSQSLINELLSHDRLQVVTTTYGPDQPEHR